VELGTYAGYSAYCFALALSHNGFGSIDCYDLWDDYLYNHVSMAEADRNLKGVPASLHKEDYKTVHSHYKQSSVDFLMVDVSNDGDVYRNVLKAWKDIISPNGIIAMEGGTEERDKWDWMVKYYKVPIANALNDEWVNENFNYTVVLPFPGVTLFTKKHKHLVSLL
jgi:predicted O-methyltransferase YrrM